MLSFSKRPKRILTLSQEDAPAGGGTVKRRRSSVKSSRAPFFKPLSLAKHQMMATLKATNYGQINSGNTGSFGIQWNNSFNSNTPGGAGGSFVASCTAGVRFSLSKVRVDGQTSSTESPLGQYSEFVNLFKYYRIKRVRVCITMLGAPPDNQWYPNLYLATDSNDVNTGFASIDEMRNFSGLKQYQFGMPSANNGKQWFTLYPRVMESVAVSAGDTTTKPANGPVWLSTNNPDILHYGLKLGYDNPSLGSVVTQAATYQGTLVFTYYVDVEFRGIA